MNNLDELNSKYYKKYLKYKNKYLILKNQVGGTWADIELKSNEEVNCYENSLKYGHIKNDCKNSYYNFTKFDPDFAVSKCNNNKEKCKCLGYDNVTLDGKKCLLCLKDARFVDELNNEDAHLITSFSSKYDNNFKILKVCNKINEVGKYFSTNPNPFNKALDLKTKLTYSSPLNHILLDSNKYLNLTENLSLQSNKDLICLEGNIVYVDQTCKVGSGGITSCLFMVLVLDDNTSIVCHMNGFVSNVLPFRNHVAESTSYFFTHTTCFDFIKAHFNIGKLEKIYLTGVLANYILSPKGFNYDYDFSNPNSLLAHCTGSSSNKLQLVQNIKDNLGVDRNKCVDFIFDNVDESGNYILANNQLYKVNEII